MKKIYEVSLLDLMPENLAEDEKVKYLALALDPHLQQVAYDSRMAVIHGRLHELSSLQLDHLAVQFNVAVWDSFWDTERKIAVLLATVETKRYRGTTLAVKEAIESIVGDAYELIEWFDADPKLEPYNFQIEVFVDDVDGGFSIEDQKNLEDLVYEAKSIRSHGLLILVKKTIGEIDLTGVLQSAVFNRISGGELAYGQNLNIGAVLRSSSYARISGEEEPGMRASIRLTNQLRSSVYNRLQGKQEINENTTLTVAGVVTPAVYSKL